jgi:glutamyl-tRNA reductase
MSVSTSGKSCRQSRLIKDNLSKHLNSIESSDLLVLGTSHELISMEERSPFHLLMREREAMGTMISQVWGVHEFLILNTCNRIELIAAISRDTTTSGILRRLMGFDRLRPDLYYLKFGYEAFEHICRVTAGIDSQTPGEYHVVSQVKDAVEEATARGWSGSIIRELCDTSLKVSKDIRHRVAPLLDIAEIEEVCIRYIDQTISILSDKRVLVAGTGMVGRGVIDALVKRHVSCFWGYHKNIPSDFDPELVELVQFDQLADVLPAVDIVVSAVDVTTPLINADQHSAAIRTDSDVTLIDLGMPRNIDPALGALGSNVQVVDLDVLKAWYRKTSGTLDQVMTICAEITEANRDKYERIRNSMQGEL